MSKYANDSSVAQVDLASLPATSLLSNQLNLLDAKVPEQLKPAVVFLKDKFLPLLTKIEAKTHSFPILISIYKSAKIPPITFALAVLLAVLAGARRLFKSKPALISNLIGFTYPAYRSLLTIERPRQDDDERFLTYWSVYGLFTILDQFSDTILHVFPLYFTSKSAVLYWLFARDGALKVYRHVARPVLVKYTGLNPTVGNSSGTSTPTTAANSRHNSPLPYSMGRP
ncbi:Receptor expression-enhancing protein 6 [Chytridiales sp. JEL 0842]|nr:Receptor expression-enhancing protein 6 [Chytridiales sp. JEL 0842]